MKNTINIFYNKKNKEKITMLTCYDYSTATILNQTDIDSILIGDSLGMVFQGNEDTLSVTVEDIIYHTKCVVKGAKDKFIISDMPFLSYHVSTKQAVKNAGKIIQEGRSHAVKLEGGKEIIDKIKAIVNAQIPVMGHLGLTPQSINIFGGYKVQGKSYQDAKKIIEDALLLQDAGCFAIVLECVPEELAKLITNKLEIATIGIGAGKYTDGQILVINDMIGSYDKIIPKFVKNYSNVKEDIKTGINSYIYEVKNQIFPDNNHIYKIDNEIIEQLYNEFK